MGKVKTIGVVNDGGSLTPFDRIPATRIGVHGTDLVARGEFGRMVCLRAGKIESVTLEEALSQLKMVDPASEIVHVARAIGTTFGDFV
jgi:6-phosphofructokinase